MKSFTRGRHVVRAGLGGGESYVSYQCFVVHRGERWHMEGYVGRQCQGRVIRRWSVGRAVPR